MMEENTFNRLKIEQRYALLRDEGSFIASRFSGGYNVHLFGLEGFYVELWQTIGMNDVVFIEIQKNESILREYLGNIDLKKDLGL